MTNLYRKQMRPAENCARPLQRRLKAATATQATVHAGTCLAGRMCRVAGDTLAAFTAMIYCNDLAGFTLARSIRLRRFAGATSRYHISKGMAHVLRRCAPALLLHPASPWRRQASSRGRTTAPDASRLGSRAISTPARIGDGHRHRPDLQRDRQDVLSGVAVLTGCQGSDPGHPPHHRRETLNHVWPSPPHPSPQCLAAPGAARPAGGRAGCARVAERWHLLDRRVQHQRRSCLPWW